MYSSASHRQSAARISNPVWSRQNVNKQRSSAVLRDCGVIRNFQISKFIKSVRKSGAFRKEFASERERMSDSPRKNHPARQIRRGHCLTFKKNRHRDEELLEINRTVDSDNKPVITRSDNADNRTWSSQSLAQSSVTVEKIDDSFNKQTEFSKDVSRDRTFCTGKVNSECLTFSCDHEQSSGNVAGLSRDTGRGSRSSIEEYDGRQSGVLDQEQRLHGAVGCATGVPSGNATGDSSSNSSAVSSSNSTAVSSRSNSSYVSPSISTAVNLGAESSSLGIPSPENSSPGYTSSSSNSTSVSSISSPTQSSHLLSLLDQISSISCQTKDVQNIPLPTQLPLKSQASSNLPPSNERTVIGRELTPPRKDDIESNSQSSSSASSSSRRNNRKPPPSNNSQPHIESNVREEADGSEDPPDPEVEELSRMRCPSDSTEVIAERENRRRQRQRRCADYPGLAFGSSIFSSDTMMRFNLIRNELQNIRNSQLKRVRVYKIISNI